MIHPYYAPWRSLRPAVTLFLCFLLGSGTLAAQSNIIDFEDLLGQQTTSPELDAKGISFGTPSININTSVLNTRISPVNVQERDGAFSGARFAVNCSQGIDCEFPSGAVLMEFSEVQSLVTFQLRGDDGDGVRFLIYAYDEAGNLELATSREQNREWQLFRVPNAKGIIIDTDIPPGGGGFRSYSLDDITLSPVAPDRIFDCATAEGYDERLANDPIFREAIERVERLTAEYIENIATEDPYGFGSEVITIPVVVHVVYNNATENISDAQVQSQITALNDVFRATNTGIGALPGAFSPLVSDLRIQFALAQRDPNCEPTDGITRTETSQTSFSRSSDPMNLLTPQQRNPVKFNSSGGRDGWPSDEYLNLWVCDLNGGLLGYATFPADLATRPTEDGVVMDYTAFGTTGTVTSPFDLGRVGAHEVGHWLNLRHIWADDQNQADNCSGTDFVDDTPNQAVANTGTPTFPDVSCGNGPNGDLFYNHMDYTDDATRVLFTLGQHVRAAATLFGVRASLIGSDGLVPPPAAPAPDLWSQDTPDDVGDEPNPSSFAMYHSADIWVRNTNDGLTNQEHQNPVYRSSGEPNYVYVRVRNRGCSESQSGTTRLYWAKASSGLSWPSPWDGSVVSPALMGNPIGDSPVTVAAGDFEILQFEWVVPNPDDYVSFGADRSHFCLLSRIETAGGMTFPETTNLYANVQNNNNIVWKNISVLTADDEGGFSTDVIVGNFSEAAQRVRLQFDLPRDELRSLFDFGRVVLLLNKLNEPWQEGGAEGDNIEPLGNGEIELLGPGALLDNIVLEPGDLFGVEVRFIPDGGPGINNVFKLNLNQIDLETQAIIGGNQFRFKTLGRGVIRPGTGGGGTGNNTPPVFVDCPDDVPAECEFPLTVRVDMANVPAPDDSLGNFSAILSWDPSLIEYIGDAEVLSGFAGFFNVGPSSITFNGASATGRSGNVPIFTANFRAIGAPGAAVTPDLELLTLGSAGTFKDILPDASVFECDFEILPALLLGDVNGDNRVNSFDAAIILAFSVGNPIPPLAQQRIALGIGDVDRSGATDPRDALIVLSYEVGLPVNFPIGEPTGCNAATDETLGSTPRGRASLEVPLTIDHQAGSSGPDRFPITVDLSAMGERLGSYQLQLSWDSEQWRFIGFEAGNSNGFAAPTVNDRSAVEGRLLLAHANPNGAAGLVEIGTVLLEPIGEIAPTEPGVEVRVGNLTAARTFTDLSPVWTAVTAEMELMAFPNPTTGSTQIRLSLPQAARVELGVYNLRGQLVQTLFSGERPAGTTSLLWDANDQGGERVASGVYLVRGNIGNEQITHKVVLF